MAQLRKVSIHLLLVFAAFVFAYAIRIQTPLSWWLLDPGAPQALIWAALYTVVAGAVEMIFRVERASWRFASLREVLTLVRSTSLTAAIFLILIFMGTRAFLLPRSMLPLTWLFSFTGLVGVRVLARLVDDPTMIRAFFTVSRQAGAPMALVGDIRHVDSYLRRRATDGDRRYWPVAILSTDEGERGEIVGGVPIVGRVSALARPGAIKALSSAVLPALLFLDDPIKDLGLTSEDIGGLRRSGYKLLRQPSVVELHREEGHPHTLREINLEECMTRAPVTLDPKKIHPLLSGKRILVTGAGGSIGSEIARQVAAFDCAHLSLLDQSEYALFEIHRDLEGGPRRVESLSPVLCNVREGDRVREVFAAEAPDIVFHAAALKHVTLVENNPCEGVLTNIVGTSHVAAAAVACGALQLTMISTDKAVAPSCVMGATKRIAESLLPANGSGATRFCVVRFGNVLGSTGSVVPIFRAEIEAGGPVTVTHPDVERYFMTISEAVQLVLHASALNSQGDDLRLRKFVLSMGEPVKIIDLARQMIELSGHRPDIDIAIEFTGLKPGEKISEALIDSHEFARKELPGMTEISSRFHDGGLNPQLAVRFEHLARTGDNRAVRQLISETLARARGVEPEPDEHAYQSTAAAS